MLKRKLLLAAWCVILAWTMFPAQAPAADQAALSAEQASFEAFAPITVSWAGLPGNAQDWLTLVPAGTPADQWGTWFYTGGAASGSYQFPGMPGGEYEVRAYLDWPDGGYAVAASMAVTVSGPGPSPANEAGISITPAAESFAAGQPIQVAWAGMPGNLQDWVTLIPADAPVDEWGDWVYTSGATAGSCLFGGVIAGQYEVRAYLNWPEGGYQVVARQAVTVR